MLIGYARVSTVAQDVEVQLTRLQELGVSPERIYIDRGFSGKTMTRDGLDQAMAACREGDTFVVPRLDRLARNLQGSIDTMQELADRKIAFNIGGTLYDPHDPMSKLVFQILAAVAECEGGWISLRTKEAMARPSVRAKMKGRVSKFTPRLDALIYDQYERGEIPVGEIAKLFNTSRTSAYRAIERHTARLQEAAGSPQTGQKSTVDTNAHDAEIGG